MAQNIDAMTGDPPAGHPETNGTESLGGEVRHWLDGLRMQIAHLAAFVVGADSSLMFTQLRQGDRSKIATSAAMLVLVSLLSGVLLGFTWYQARHALFELYIAVPIWSAMVFLFDRTIIQGAGNQPRLVAVRLFFALVTAYVVSQPIKYLYFKNAADAEHHARIQQRIKELRGQSLGTVRVSLDSTLSSLSAVADENKRTLQSYEAQQARTTSTRKALEARVQRKRGQYLTCTKQKQATIDSCIRGRLPAVGSAVRWNSWGNSDARTCRKASCPGIYPHALEGELERLVERERQAIAKTDTARGKLTEAQRERLATNRRLEALGTESSTLAAEVLRPYRREIAELERQLDVEPDLLQAVSALHRLGRRDPMGVGIYLVLFTLMFAAIELFPFIAKLSLMAKYDAVSGESGRELGRESVEVPPKVGEEAPLPNTSIVVLGILVLVSLGAAYYLQHDFKVALGVASLVFAFASFVVKQLAQGAKRRAEASARG